MIKRSQLIDDETGLIVSTNDFKYTIKKSLGSNKRRILMNIFDLIAQGFVVTTANLENSVCVSFKNNNFMRDVYVSRQDLMNYNGGQ